MRTVLVSPPLPCDCCISCFATVTPRPQPLHLLPADGAEGGEGHINSIPIRQPIFPVIPVRSPPLYSFQALNRFFPRPGLTSNLCNSSALRIGARAFQARRSRANLISSNTYTSPLLGHRLCQARKGLGPVFLPAFAAFHKPCTSFMASALRVYDVCRFQKRQTF